MTKPGKDNKPKHGISTIVGIGASAGGLSALQKLLDSIPEDTGMAFVVIMHLSPEHKSILSELLQPHSKLKVQQVQATIPLKPNNVYVIPPNANLNSIDTHLRLSELEEERSNRAPIDHFFRTLAATHDGHAIGIILTGTGSDGSLGIKDIKGRNGIVIVQDPNEAQYDGMPQSAIATGMVDLILPLAEIPKQLVALGKVKLRIKLHEDGKQPDADKQEMLQKLFAQVKTRTGRDFSRYKISTIMRRIQRRMQIYNQTELEDYLKLLRQKPDEISALSDDFLITVTNFFRDPEVFKKMKKDVVPRLFKDKDPDDQVRIWSVGCATGEEAYSLAILMLEEASQQQLSPAIQIFASDLHEPSLKMAREGFYPGDIELDVSQERLKRFFIKEDGGYRVRKEVRELIIFTPHNILNDPPFSKLDMIVCRNLLIYLKRDIQQDVFNLFHYSLLPNGILTLGTSEHLDSSEIFRTEHKTHSFYTKRNVAGPEPKLPVFPTPKLHIEPEDFSIDENHNYSNVNSGQLHQHMVERFAPPSVLISSDNQIMHLSESAGRYLVYPGGEPTQHLFKLVKEELRIELRAALQEAREKEALVRSQPVKIKLDGQLKQVRVSVRVNTESKQEKLALIIFEEELPKKNNYEKAIVKADGKQGQAVEDELLITQQRLQGVIEEYENSQEEMKASNEELQSANEELRSTMEELETSKEELQSMNEELNTVNQENKHKVEELSQLTSDLQNLLSATDIATLFLDRNFQILRFTPKVGEIFSIRPADKGRPITDLNHRLGYPELIDDARQVLKKLVPIEKEVNDNQDHWYLTRVLPYRSSQDRIEGVVITFVDITSRKNAEEALRQSEEQFRALVEASSPTLWNTNSSGEIVEDSPSWRTFTGQSFQEWKGNGWINAVHPQDRELITHQWQQTVAEEGIFNVNYRLWHQKSKNWRWTNARAVPLRHNDNSVRGWMGMNIDINELKDAEHALRESSELLEMARFASKLGWGTWDFKADEVYWDDRGKEIFGLSGNLNNMQIWLEKIVAEDRDKVEEMLTDCWRNEKDFDLEFGIEPENEKEVHVHVTAAFKNNADGNKKGTGHVRNITHKKMLQKQKDDFMNMASHEMKTPVAVMKGYVSMIQESLEQKEETKKELNLIGKLNNQVNRLTSLINDLLDITRIESGKIEYNKEQFMFDELVQETIESIRPIAKQKIEVTGSSEKMVKADRDRIGQVIINFLTNAMKYSPGKEDIIVSIKEEKGQVQVSVQDFGVGIDEKNKELIFDRYFRATEHSSSTPGLGLGLYISAQIIERHNGHIRVESVIGDGAVFSFSLPVNSSNN